MEIQLNKKTKEYLLNALKKENEDIFLQLQLGEEHTLGSASNLIIREDLVDVIREWALAKQQLIGFDIDYDFTYEGELLQEIIDKFYF